MIKFYLFPFIPNFADALCFRLSLCCPKSKTVDYSDNTTCSVVKPAYITAHSCTPIVDNIDGTKIQVYPNPISDKLTINFGEIISGNIELYDEIGKQISSSEIIYQDEALLEMSHLASGIYFLKIKTGNYLLTKKILKY